ncbi:MCE family protein [Aureimonas mangrovi]|uniref:MlaD family protein n=1 Tax=Aureimonas mangrovi TaxID=2758041 RepID=UPI00163D7529|nr:MlaD family protein [Aureimonas mangrovi]
MENRANYVLVGIFTLVILAASFGFVYWSANVSDSNTRVPLVVRIQGSVSGLSQGSQVLFNGLNVGSVTNLRIDPNDPRTVIATTQVDRNTPITTSTQASIGFQGLTGIGFIGLTGGNMNDRNIITSALEQGATPVIRANPSDVTDILATARDISDRANNILGEFERLVQEVGPAVTTTANNIARTSGNVDIFTASLAENADQIEDFVGSLGRLATSANGVALQLPGLIDEVSAFIGALDSQSINQSIENVAAITDAVREQTPAFASAIESVSTAAEGFGVIGETVDRNADQIDQFLANLGPLSESATSVATRLDSTLQSAQAVIEAIDVATIDQAIDNIADFTGTIRGQNAAIARAVAAIADGAENFDAFGDAIRQNIAGISQFLGTLGPISDRATSIAGNLDETLVSAREISAAIDPAQVRSTVESVSGFTSALNERSPQVQEFISGANIVLTSLQQSLAGLDDTRGLVDQILAGIDPALVNQAVTDVSAASGNIASAADEVGNIARDIGARREDIDTIITDVQETSANLRVASARVDAVIAQVDTLLNGPNSEGLTSQARETLVSIQEAANAIRSGITPISASVTNLSDQSLREIQGLARTTTDSITRVERAITDLANNPSRIITGGSGSGDVRQFDGRTRR